MASLTERLAFLISANADDAIRAFEKTGSTAEKELGRAEDKIKKLGSHLTMFGAGAMAFAGVAGRGLYELAQASESAEMQTRKLANSIANNGSYASGAQKRLQDLARATMEVTAADDDAIIGAQALMVQFGLTEQQVSTLTPLVVDLSRKMGVDMDTAAKAVAKSVDGTSTALKKMGIDVQSVKDGGDAFNNTVDALRGSVGGFAQQEAETFSGKMEKLKVSLGNLAEGVGSGVVDVFSSMADGVTKASNALGKISPEAQAAAGRFMAIGTAAIGAVGALSFVAGQVTKLKDRFTDSSGALTNWGKAAVGVTAALGAVGAVMAIVSANAASDNKHIENAAKAIQAMGGSADSELPKLFAFVQQMQQLAGKGSDAATVLGLIAKESVSTAQRFVDLGIVTDKFGLSADEANKIIAAQVELNRRAADTAEKDAASTSGQADSKGDLANAAGDAADATTDLADATDEEAQAAKDAAEAQKKHEEAITEAFDAARSAVDANYALRDAQRDYKDAIDELNTVLKDSKSNEYDRAEALDKATQKAIDVADAELRLADERAAASGVTLTAKEREEIWRQSLLKTAETLDPSGQLRQNLWGVAADVKQATASRELKVTADTRDVNTKLSQLSTTLDGQARVFTQKGTAIGASTADGIERGLRSGQYKVEVAAGDVAHGALMAAKRALGIFSPSQVMADEVGTPISEGIAQGITESSDAPISALEAVGYNISERAGQIVSDANAVIEDVVRSAQNAFDETLNLIDGRRDQEDAAQNVREAEERLADAQKRLKDVVKESGRGSEEYKRAQDAVAQAQRNLEDANYRLLQVSYDLIEQGPEGVAQFEDIAAAAGLNRDEIDKLVQSYLDLAAARIAEAEAAKKAEQIKNSEDAVGGGSLQDAADQATKALQDKIKERNKLAAKGQDTTAIEKDVAKLAVAASKAFAETQAKKGTDAYYKAQLDALLYFVGTNSWLSDELSNLIETIKGKIPAMAAGGIVSTPTLAMIGEAGPEAVVPLDRLSSTSSGSPSVVVNVSGSVVTERDLVRTIRDALIAEQRRGKQLIVN